jgi:hypothetical protein
MTQITWPMAVILVAVVTASAGLAAAHVISSDWIERTLTGIIGFVLGHSIGFLQRRSPSAVTILHRDPPTS